MINAIKNVRVAWENYNSETGEGANELLKASLHYISKKAEFDEALEKVGKILEERKKK